MITLASLAVYIIIRPSGDAVAPGDSISSLRIHASWTPPNAFAVPLIRVLVQPTSYDSRLPEE